MFAGAASFTDEADIKTTEAVNMLSALGVIKGYTDGSFKPDATITRAEMAKMIYVLRTGSDNAKAYESTSTKFTDLNTSSSSWAAPYIKYCEAMGIIAGKSATKFDPDATVTGEETAKMLLVTVGYDATKAKLVGTGWAQRATALATETGLLEDVDASLGLALPRQWAAQMIYNAIDADTVSYNADGQVVKTEKTETSLDSKETGEVVYHYSFTGKDGGGSAIEDDGYSSYAEAKDAAVSAGGTKLVTGDPSSNGDYKIVKDAGTKLLTWVETTETKNETVGQKYLDLKNSVGLLMASGNESMDETNYASGDDVLKINNSTSESDINSGSKNAFTKVKTDYTSLLGQRVKVLYKDTDDVIGVYAVDENKVVKTVKASALDSVSGSNNTKKIDVDGTKYTMDDAIEFYIDGVKVAGATSTAKLTNFLATSAAKSDFDAYVISNDDNEKIDIVRVNTKRFAKVTSLTSSKIYYKPYTDGSAGAALNVDNDDDVTMFDGMAKDDYVFVSTDGFTGNTVFEKATKVTGKTDSKKSDQLRIDGTWYNIENAKASASENNWKINSSYDVYVYGGYAYLVEGASGSDIDTMVVKSVGDAKKMDKGVEVKVLNEDGTESIINVVKVLTAAQDTSDTGTDFTDGTGSALTSALTPLVGTMVAYYEDDGDYTLQALPASGTAVKDIEDKGTTTDFTVKTGAYNKDRATIAGLDVANDAVIYISYNSGDDYKVVTGKAFMSYSSVANVTALYDTSDKDYVKVALVKYAGTASSGDDMYGMVTSTYEAKDSENDKTVTYFTMLTPDGVKEDVESDAKYTGEKTKKGAIITFNGSYTLMEDVTLVSDGQYGAVKAYNSDTKRVSFYQGLSNDGTLVTLDTAKITGDTAVLYVDQTGSDWTVVDSGEPDEATEHFDANGVVDGYYANIFAVVNEDAEFDLLVYEVNNEMKDTSKDTFVLENGATPVNFSANAGTVAVNGMDITVEVPAGTTTVTLTADNKAAVTFTAGTVSGTQTSQPDVVVTNQASATIAVGGTTNLENGKTSSFDLTASESGKGDLVYNVTIVVAAS